MVFSRLYTHLTSPDNISKPSPDTSPKPLPSLPPLPGKPDNPPPQGPPSEPSSADPITLLKLEIQHISALIASDHAAGKATEYLDSILEDLVAKLLDETARKGMMEFMASEEWVVTEEEREVWEEYPGEQKNGDVEEGERGEEEEDGIWWERPWDMDFSDEEDEREVLHGSFTMLQLHERNS